MYQNKNAKLSLTLYDRTVSVEWPSSDIDLDELFDTFIRMLVTQTYDKDSIEQYLKDRMEEQNNGI